MNISKEFAKKKDPYNGVFYGFTKSSVSLFPLFSVKPLLHTYTDYFIKFFFVEGLNGVLLNCHMYQFPILGNKGKNPNSKEKVFTYQRLMFE